MKANDLRIGSLVNFQIGNTIKQGWVININRRKINILTCLNFKGNYPDFRMIQGGKTYTIKPCNLIPIPLTEEWLVKSQYAETIKEWKGNGQDYQPETSKTKQRRFYLIEGIYLVFEYWSYRTNEKDKWITERSICIEYYNNSLELTEYYIHIFQNLFFALTGKELTINE